MKFEDLKSEFIQTIMATQRMVCLPSGYAISFMGFEQDSDVGDGTDDFLVRVYKHNLKLNEAIDFFSSDYSADDIDLHNCIISLRKVPIEEIDSFFKVFA